MSRSTASIRGVVLLLIALAAYIGLIGYRAVDLLGQRSATLKVLGAAVIIIPLVGIWVVLAELRFGRDTARLATRLNAEGDPGDPELPRTSSGRVDRAAADAFFEQRKAEVEADPSDWRTWYRLAIAYDLAGDRRRAREAMRTAIANSRAD